MSDATKSPGRKVFEHSVLVPGVDAATVWRALSEGEQLKQWFPIDARVRPGAGGGVFLSWGPGCEGEAPIVKWEPGRVLGWEETHPDAQGAGAVKICAEFHVSADPARGGTVVRVVQSGFGQGTKWDDMYDSIANGWKYELFSLAHWLTRHRDKTRAMFWAPCELPAERAFEVIAEDGALVRGQDLSRGSAGEKFEFEGPDGVRYSGTVVRMIPGRSWVGMVSELDDALLRIEAERMGPGSMPFVSLSIWGPKKSESERLQAAWSGRLKEVLASGKSTGA